MCHTAKTYGDCELPHLIAPIVPATPTRSNGMVLLEMQIAGFSHYNNWNFEPDGHDKPKV